MKRDNFRRLDILFLTLILLTAFVFRLYKLNIPLADLHSWRQADTAAVARNFLKYGFDLLHPRYDDLSSIQSGIENPQGYRFVEFPLYNAVFAFLYKQFPYLSLEQWGRLTTISFSLLIIALVYYFLLKEEGRLAAVTGSLVYAIFPFFVFFSRVILPETTAIAFVFLSIFCLYITPSGKKIRLKTSVLILLSAVFFAISLLIKPTTIFFAITLLFLLIRTIGWKKIYKNPSFYCFFLISFLPLIAWRIYIQRYPQGVPYSQWLLFEVNTSAGRQNIFFRPAFFRWVFGERISNLILGSFSVVFLIIGIFKKPKNFFFISLLLSSLLYLFTFQGGSVQHEYYQILILPILAIFIGMGVSFFSTQQKIFINQYLLFPGIFLIMTFSFYLSFYKVRDFYNYPIDLPNIAKIISTLTSPQDKIITDTTGDTTLLYLANRRGTPAVYKDLDQLKKLDYRYFVTYNKEVINQIKTENKFTLVFENDKFAIFRL